MKLLVLATAATFALTATAMASETTKHKRVHYRDANASIAEEGAAPADTLGAHELYIMNLRDSGYNPSRDRDAAGNMRAN